MERDMVGVRPACPDNNVMSSRADVLVGDGCHAWPGLPPSPWHHDHDSPCLPLTTASLTCS